MLSIVVQAVVYAECWLCFIVMLSIIYAGVRAILLFC
jgi:hypothetical protein